MKRFFIPGVETAQEAEEVYSTLEAMAAKPIARPHARLRQIGFVHRNRTCTASVGREITNWLERSGMVVAIVETMDSVKVYTRLQTGDITECAALPPHDVRRRIYFDEYPSEPAGV